MTKEELQYLSQFERNYYTALNSNYTSAIWNDDLNEMLKIYKKYKGDYNLCKHCSASILAFVKKVGLMYEEEKNKISKEEENAKENEGESNSQRKKSNKRKKTKLQYIAGLFRKGWSKLSVSEEIQKKWGCKPQMAAMYIRDAYEYMSSGDEAFIKNLRRVQLERLELILMKVMEKEDWKTANQIIDTINKTFALYEIKTKVEISDNTIQFKFGDNPVQDAVIEGETTKAIETSNDENNEDENDDIE